MYRFMPIIKRFFASKNNDASTRLGNIISERFKLEFKKAELKEQNVKDAEMELTKINASNLPIEEKLKQRWNVLNKMNYFQNL